MSPTSYRTAPPRGDLCTIPDSRGAVKARGLIDRADPLADPGEEVPEGAREDRAGGDDEERGADDRDALHQARKPADGYELQGDHGQGQAPQDRMGEHPGRRWING